MPKKSGSAKSQQPEVQLAEPESGGKRRKGEEAAPAAKAAPASKKQRKAAAAEVVEAAEAAEGPSTSGRGGSEIDELFGALRKGSKAKAGAAKLEATEEAQPQEQAPVPAKVVGSKDDIFGTEGGKARKRTEEGYVVYTEEELGFTNKKNAGKTPQCPFDCDCCFI